VLFRVTWFCVTTTTTTTTVHLYVRFGFRGTRRRKKSLSLFTQTPKFTREESHDETLIWSKEDRRSAFVGGHDE
jgi:hypothetical protein